MTDEEYQGTGPVKHLVRDRKERIEQEMFSIPPKTWDEFQKRYGAWHELDLLLDEIEDRETGSI